MTDLTPTAAIVLGLLELAGESTPYALKQGVNATVGNFWTVQHAQLYSEPERLAKRGLVTERREDAGRRRRFYAITDAGREALAAWRDTPAERIYELRDTGLLKLFFGADPKMIAAAQLTRFEAKHAELVAMRDLDTGDAPRGPFLALEAGIRHAELSISYWRDILTTP